MLYDIIIDHAHFKTGQCFKEYVKYVVFKLDMFFCNKQLLFKPSSMLIKQPAC